MNRRTRLFVALLFILMFVVPAAPALAQVPLPPWLTDPFYGCEGGIFADTGATWAICMPERVPGLAWNDDLIIYAHGYVSPYPDRAPVIPVDQYFLPGDTPGSPPVPFTYVANQLGYAFATTSFRTNGLAVKDGVADIMELRGKFKELHPMKPRARSFVFGASEGGLITTKVIETKPAQFDGGIAACGPIGDFRLQVNHVGDMRVAFDASFPGLLPPSAISIPEPLMDAWDPTVPDDVTYTLARNLDLTAQLLNITHTPVDPANPAETAVKSVVGVLWYNIFGTNDAIAKMGGNPFQNVGTDYSPLTGVARFTADTNALASLKAHYQTSGRLKTPLVTMHNVGDPIVPYEHEVLYQAKVQAALGTEQASHYLAEAPVTEYYGHCKFTSADITVALAQLQDLIKELPERGGDHQAPRANLNRDNAP